MKTSNYQYFALVLLFAFFSCSENELNLYPETVATESSFYKDEAQLLQASNDVYRQLSRIYDAGGIPDIYGELSSDNVFIKFSAGGTTAPEDINKHRIATNNEKIKLAWENAYNAIFICNNVINKLDNTTVEFANSTLKTRLKAEALFVRSLIYFNLVRAWGGIPFPLKVISATEAYSYLRETPDKIYSQLIVDLQYCEQNLSAAYTGTDIGRITKYGASAVLAKIYLTRNDKANAKTALETVINSGRFSLDANGDGVVNVEDYKHLFKADVKNSKESIVEAQYLAGQNNANSTHQAQYTPYNWAFHLPTSTETFRGEGMNTPTQNLLDEFEAADQVRKNISAYPGYVNLANNQMVDYPFTQKFFDPNWRFAGQNFEIIRYADILLMYSEVTNNPEYLNQVRARVGLVAFGSTGYPATYTTLERAIEHERRVELCFEYHRFFDLVRTGRAVDVIKATGYNINVNHLLLPIPQSVIDVNPKITENP